MTAEADAKVKMFLEALDRGEWDKSLELLRQCRAFLGPCHVSDFRGKIWLEAGDQETAALFLDHAAELSQSAESHSPPLLQDLGMVESPPSRV